MWKLADSSPRWIAHKGALPERLYRYRRVTPETLDRLINFEVLGEAVFLAALKDLNDPDEFRFVLKFNGTREEIFNHWCALLREASPATSVENIEAEARVRAEMVLSNNNSAPIAVLEEMRNIFSNVMRVACFTTDPVNYSMWANYAQCVTQQGATVGHGGICIEYVCDEGWRHSTLCPVEYSHSIPVLNVLSRDEADMVGALYSKAYEWRAEEEWRITGLIHAMPPFPENLAANAKVKFEGAVASVIFGMATPNNVIEEIASQIRAKNSMVALKRVVRDSVSYERKVIAL